MQDGVRTQVDVYSYNPVDVEDTIERCHEQLLVGGVLVWQMEDGSVIAAVEVDREQDCFKIAPLIAAAVVTRHKVQAFAPITAMLTLMSPLLTAGTQSHHVFAAKRRAY
jgi:hypothetical protein